MIENPNNSGKVKSMIRDYIRPIVFVGTLIIIIIIIPGSTVNLGPGPANGLRV